jgi:short-subunit dehydrogenase
MFWPGQPSASSDWGKHVSEDGAATFASKYGPWALVAGASDGLGEAFAHELARRGLNVVLLARRAELLASVAADVERDHGVSTQIVVADLTASELGGIVSLGLVGLDIGLLVYNAGAVHGAAKFLDRPLQDTHSLINLNCHGPATLAHLLGQPMRERGRGGMVFMSSMAALAGSAYIATYAATKAFDIIFAEALWQEMQGDGIDVVSVIAGATDTPAMRRSLETFGDRPDLAEPSFVALEALNSLGVGPTCVPGEGNRQVASYLWPRSRVSLSTMMSQATAEMYAMEATGASGRDFGEVDQQ